MRSKPALTIIRSLSAFEHADSEWSPGEESRTQMGSYTHVIYLIKGKDTRHSTAWLPPGFTGKLREHRLGKLRDYFVSSGKGSELDDVIHLP